MNRAVPLSLCLALALACGGLTLSAPDLATDEPLAADEPDAAQDGEDADEDGYVYAPGPNGVADARFTRWEVDDALYAAERTPLLASPNGAPGEVLPHGAEVTVLEVDPKPVVVDGRRNQWLRVAAGDGPSGWVFGARLTPLRGEDSFTPDGDDEVVWTVHFDEGFQPFLTFGLDGAPLRPTERFVGGRLDADVIEWGELESRIQVELCRVDGGEQPACSTATAQVVGAVAQVGPPDPWRFAPYEDAPDCGEQALALERLPTPRDRMVVQTPAYMRGSDGSVRCTEFARVTSEPHRGQAVIGCVQSVGGKTGPDTAVRVIYLADGDTWTHVPCGSSIDDGASELHAALADRGIRVGAASPLRLPEPFDGPETLPAAHGELIKAWVTLESNVPAQRTQRFEVPGVGGVGSADDPGSASTGKGALYLPLGDGAVALYRWEPGGLTWESAEPERGFTAQTMGCDGSPEWLDNVETGIDPSDLTPVAKASGAPVGVLTDPAHPVNQRLFAEYKRLTSLEGYGAPSALRGGMEIGELLATRPWLFVVDPWGRVIRLMRDDFEVPVMCEPIVYVYADPPREVLVAPVEPLRFFRTRPHGPDGWTGTAWPDGSVTVDGRRWPELFWEGRSVRFDPPEHGVVVAGRDAGPVLREEGAARGLIGHELDAFVDAWAPRLAPYAWVRLGFHPPDAIDRIAPLRVEPPPDVTLRVLLDAVVVDGPGPGSLPEPSPPPERAAYTFVEWGGLLRP